MRYLSPLIAPLQFPASSSLRSRTSSGSTAAGAAGGRTAHRFLLTTQGTTGQLWRIDLRTRQIAEVDLGGTRLVNADGIVLRGRTLWVVQNFTRQITKLRLRNGFSSATVEEVLATPAGRTFTTAKRVGGRLLVVDSKFGFPPAAAVAEDRVVTIDAF